MLDAICVFDELNPIIYSIFEFQRLSETEIDKLRYSLLCPACKEKAYFRRASKDGKQACFGSRYHQLDCEEFNPSVRKAEEEKQVADIEKILLDEDALVIDFNKPLMSKKTSQPERAEAALAQTVELLPAQNQLASATNKAKQATACIEQENKPPRIAKQGLAKLLTSLLRSSSLATSDLWIYTSETHKWRAKNLFVNIADAQPTENGAPRMYWGTISHADKTLNWLNPAEDRTVALPISKYREELLTRFDIENPRDVEGAGFIVFAKCIPSKDKKRHYIQLWGNDLQYIHLSKLDE